MNDTTYGNSGSQHFQKGTPVFDVNGDKLGSVAESGQLGNELIIQKGLFFPKDFPVPASAIARTEADGIYLKVTKEDASNGNWGNASNMVDTETPYRANPAQSVGDMPLNANQPATGDLGASRDQTLAE